MFFRNLFLSSLIVSGLALGSACNNNVCEEGAVCNEGQARSDSARECNLYCARLVVCDAPQADDFEACVASCSERFKEDPRQMAELCVCAEWSSCDDIAGERCSERPHGSGGSGGSGSGGTGATGSGGTGATGSGGTGATGSGGSGAAGGSAGTGGTASDGGTPCVRDCDCPAGENCYSGVCAVP
jgi:hypothetical protein